MWPWTKQQPKQDVAEAVAAFIRQCTSNMRADDGIHITCHFSITVTKPATDDDEDAY